MKKNNNNNFDEITTMNALPFPEGLFHDNMVINSLYLFNYSDNSDIVNQQNA